MSLDHQAAERAILKSTGRAAPPLSDLIPAKSATSPSGPTTSSTPTTSSLLQTVEQIAGSGLLIGVVIVVGAVNLIRLMKFYTRPGR